MNVLSTRERFGLASQALHWITAILVVVAFIYGPGGSEQRVYSAARDFDRQLHETLGLTVFALTLVRLLWRGLEVRPEPARVKPWMGFASRLVQTALYVLLVALPITAITGAWLESHPLTLLGGATVAPPLLPAHDVGAGFAKVHGWLGDAILWLAGLHALAALFHHFILKDATLRSMLPR